MLRTLLSNLHIDRKRKFLINASFITFLLYLFSFRIIPITIVNMVLVIIMLVLGVFIVHFPNLQLRNVIISSILPSGLLSGAILSLYYFPNLSLLFKIASLAVFFGFYYLISLVDNIFLVVNERKEIIPLYRAAATWSHILVIIITIPLFAGIYKIPVNFLLQSLCVAIITMFFTFYLFWATRYDKGSKDLSVEEGILISLFIAFIIFGSSISVSFVPTEAFLRSLFVSAVLMFLSNYAMTGYLKNEINKKLVIQYISILLLFLFLIFLFD